VLEAWEGKSRDGGSRMEAEAQEAWILNPGGGG
jgi:hypothetical protein